MTKQFKCVFCECLLVGSFLANILICPQCPACRGRLSECNIGEPDVVQFRDVNEFREIREKNLMMAGIDSTASVVTGLEDWRS